MMPRLGSLVVRPCRRPTHISPRAIRGASHRAAR